MQPFRWAIAGFGWVARDYMAPAIDQAGHVLAAIADPSEHSLRLGEARGARAYQNIASMLEHERPDALYVATPNHLHLAPVQAAARAGIPVLCEKPLAATLGDAEAIVRAVQHGGVLYGTAFDQRHHPAHAAIKVAIASGLIGEITAIRIVYACWVGPDWSPDGAASGSNWRADPKQAGGGAVMDLAPHGLDLITYLLGEPLTELHLTLQNRVHSYAVDDGGLLSGRTRSGALYSLHVAYNTPESLPRRRLEIIGTRGQLVGCNTMGQTEGGTLTLLCASSGEEAPLPFEQGRSPFTAQALAFAAAVRGAPHDFCAERDLALYRLLDSAYARARSCH